MPSIKEFIKTLRHCRNCENKNCSYKTLLYKKFNKKYVLESNIFIENNQIFIKESCSQVSELESIINQNDDGCFKIIFANKFYLFDIYIIDFKIVCNKCSCYFVEKSIVINQITKELQDYFIEKEIFENEDYLIENNYVENTTKVELKSKVIDLQLTRYLTLNNLNFNKLFKNSLLLK